MEATTIYIISLYIREPVEPKKHGQFICETQALMMLNFFSIENLPIDFLFDEDFPSEYKAAALDATLHIRFF